VREAAAVAAKRKTGLPAWIANANERIELAGQWLCHSPSPSQRRVELFASLLCRGVALRVAPHARFPLADGSSACALAASLWTAACAWSRLLRFQRDAVSRPGRTANANSRSH